MPLHHGGGEGNRTPMSSLLPQLRLSSHTVGLCPRFHEGRTPEHPQGEQFYNAAQVALPVRFPATCCILTHSGQNANDDEQEDDETPRLDHTRDTFIPSSIHLSLHRLTQSNRGVLWSYMVDVFDYLMGFHLHQVGYLVDVGNTRARDWHRDRDGDDSVCH